MNLNLFCFLYVLVLVHGLGFGSIAQNVGKYDASSIRLVIRFQPIGLH